MIRAVAVCLIIVAGVAVLALLFHVKWNRHANALAARRPNLTKPQFVEALSRDADSDVAEWLWDELLAYFQPQLTPHPDDNLTEDLPIDPDEPDDWCAEFCDRFGLKLNLFPHWVHNQPLTVRNFAAWLDLGRRQQA